MHNPATWNAFGHITILSVEDDSFNQEMAIAVFSDFTNVEILSAANGIEALEILEKTSPDVILLDLMMPDMNGFDTLKALREHDKHHSVPVIVVTSKEDEKKSTYKLGADDFVTKPYSSSDLRERVYEQLSIKRFHALSDTIRATMKQGETHTQEHIEAVREMVRLALGVPRKLLPLIGALAQRRADQKGTDALRLGEYAKLLSRLYGLNNQEIENIALVMSLYDATLLLLGDEELESSSYREHPRKASRLTEELPANNLINMARTVMMMHHEAWNGDGYPDGIAQDAIPVHARIVGLLDYFDELTHTRNLRTDVISASDALEVMKRDKGLRLDPMLLEMFAENFSQFVEIKNRYDI